MKCFTLALLAACVALTSSPAGAVGDRYDEETSLAPPPPPSNHTPANANNASNATATCFLNQFRSFTPDQAKAQGVDIEKTLAHKLSVGSVAFSVTLMVFGFLMLVAGWKLFTLVLFLSGFGAGALVSFFAMSTFFNQFPAMFNCWVLSGVPLVGGLVTGAIVRKTLKLAFFLVGAGVGLIFGFYAYNLGLNHYEVKTGHVRWVYYACLCVPALLCGSVSVKLEKKILAFATSLVGGFSFVIGFAFMVLNPIDPRFTNWLSPSSLAHGGDGIDPSHIHLDAFTLGPIGGAVVLSFLGTVLQTRLQGDRKNDDDDDFAPMPYGGHTQHEGYEEYKRGFWN